MPTFLLQTDLYRLLQRELPEGVYPDGAPATFLSTADMDSVAAVAASGYVNLQQIYNNYWPQLCDDVAIASWEITAFGYNLEASLTLQERQDRVVAKIIARKGIRSSDMYDIVVGIIGTDKLVEIAAWCSSGGTWIIGDNQLGITTIFGGGPRLAVTGANICSMSPMDFGLTPEQWAGIQADAYTYSVLIYGYILTAAEYMAIDKALTIAEPARSTHKIYSGLDPANQIVPLPVVDGGDAFTVDYGGFSDGGDSFDTGSDVIDGGSA